MRGLFRKMVVSILLWETRLVLKKYKPKIIAVTGTVGKTSTKDAIYLAVKNSFSARKSEKSFNSEIGLPLTVLGLQNAWNDPLGWIKNIIKGALLFIFRTDYPKLLVLEVGADRPGDIKSLLKWFRTDVVVATRFSEVPVHVEFYASPKEVFEEESSLVETLKADGTVIVNRDDKTSADLLQEKRSKILTFGFDKQSVVRGSHYRIVYSKGRPKGIQFRITHGGEQSTLTHQGMIGKHHAYPVLAAVAAALSVGTSFADAVSVLKNYSSPPGRMRILHGINQSTIIDDSYNSSPVALEEATLALGEIKTSGKKIAVIGDMLELGSFTKDEHFKAGRNLAKIANLLAVVGVRARDVAAGAREGGFGEKQILYYSDSEKAGEALKHLIDPGDLVLVKGSQGIRLEKSIEKILRNPEQKEHLLVRQDKEWLGR